MSLMVDIAYLKPNPQWNKDCQQAYQQALEDVLKLMVVDQAAKQQAYCADYGDDIDLAQWADPLA